MSVVTHGVVSIEDGTKSPVEYQPPRKVRVELHFDVIEGQDADVALAQVSAIADARVKALLGQTTEAPRATPPAPKAAEPKAAEPATAPKRAGARSEKPKPIEVKLTDEPKADPAAVSAEVIEDDFSAPADPVVTDSITDAELHSAAQKKNGDLKNPKAIRELVAKFRPAGKEGTFQLIEIPQAKRAEFLKQLSALAA